SKLVWAYGLRNPFRFHIDDPGQQVLISDVGENTWEELDLAATGGLDFGWPMREGPNSTGTVCSGTPAPTVSIAWSDHTDGAVIISAGVYRVPASGTWRFPSEYEGDAFFLDYYTGFMRRLHGSGTTWAVATPVAGQPTADHWAEGLD